MHIGFAGKIGRALRISGALPAEVRCAAGIVAPGTLVEADGALLEVQSVEGDRVPCERLGTDIVEASGADGRLLVGWTKAGVKAWTSALDLHSLGTDARLVRVLKCDSRGNVRSTKEKVVRSAGLCHHWTVQIQARSIVRAVRADGLAWTFDLNPTFKRVEIKGTCGCLSPEDDDAEALTAAEIAVR